MLQPTLASSNIHMQPNALMHVQLKHFLAYIQAVIPTLVAVFVYYFISTNVGIKSNKIICIYVHEFIVTVANADLTMIAISNSLFVPLHFITIAPFLIQKSFNVLLLNNVCKRYLDYTVVCMLKVIYIYIYIYIYTQNAYCSCMCIYICLYMQSSRSICNDV